MIIIHVNRTHFVFLSTVSSLVSREMTANVNEPITTFLFSRAGALVPISMQSCRSLGYAALPKLFLAHLSKDEGDRSRSLNVTCPSTISMFIPQP